jgi:MFS family permease
LLGGVLVATSGVDAAYWFNAATFLLSAALLVRIPAGLLQSEKAISRGHWRDIAEGVGIVARARPLLTVLVVWSIFQVSTGWMNVSEIVLAKVSFSSGAFGYGLLWAATGVGLVVGSILGGAWVDRRGVSVVYPLSLAAMAVAQLLVAVSPDVWVASAAMVLSGIGNGAAFVTNVLLVQRGAPDALRGRAFTVIMSTNFAVLSLAMLSAGPFTDAAGARWVWGTSAAVTAVAALVAVALVRPLTLVERERAPRRPVVAERNRLRI